jgi:uncharacterized membrane protein AbrB (regulator of aidB expression)
VLVGTIFGVGGADTTVVAFIHLVRLSVIILFVPNLLLLFLG